MLMNLYNFFVIDNFSTTVTFVVGLFAFIVYRLEKNDREQSSAKIVLEEVRAIERDVDKLKTGGELFSVIPYNFSSQGWNTNRHVLVKFLDQDEMLQLSLFFERVEILKDALDQWRNLYFSAMREKSSIVMQKHSQFALEKGGDKMRAVLNEKFEKDSYWFEPYSYKEQMKKTLDLIQPILTTTVGEKLKLIANKSWNQNNIG